MPRPGAVAFDTSVAHPARIYDYWLGGKDNFAADRLAAEEVLAIMPAIAQVARTVRMFLAAVVHHLAADAGIRQFLDIGTGLRSRAEVTRFFDGLELIPPGITPSASGPPAPP
jgi:hypothetical protein